MSTYREVLRLQTALLNETSVTKRRAAATALLNLVSDADTLRKLANEANPNLTADASSSSRRRRVAPSVARRHALSVLWRGVVGAAVAFMDRILLSKSKAKFCLADVQFLHGILLACHKADIGFEDAYSSHKLTKKEAKDVIKLCLDLLDDLQALQVAELQLLELTSWICSKAEYVTHFRPSTIQLLVECVEKRLLDEESSSISTTSASLREGTAAWFENLLRTASEQMITLDSILPGCIKLLSTLCIASVNNAASSSARGMPGEANLFSGIAVLLLYSPEQSIGPLSRHGRTILAYTKSRYLTAGSESQRHYLHQYFGAHLYVSQVAGKLQGLVPGDLGDLGRATLTYRQISAILELLMREALRGDYADRRGQQQQQQLEPGPKALMELVARLFACAQRMYYTLVDVERLKDTSDVNSDALVNVENLLEQRDQFSEEYLELSSLQAVPHRTERDWKTLAQSPFGMHVVQPLYESYVALSDSTDCLQHQMFEELERIRLANAVENRVLSKSVNLLVLLSTASEIFPTGNCWSSWSLSGWKQPAAGGSWDVGNLPIHICAIDELSAVIELVVGVLGASGTANGDPKLQRWSLLCLRCLVEATEIQSFFHRHEPSALQSLEGLWRAAWLTLFRSDLRYRTYTKIASTDLIGSLVVALLISMVAASCTDPALKWAPITQSRQNSFLYTRQVDIWNLPLFANPNTALNSNCFELMYSVVFHVGLSEGQDSVSVAVDDDGISLNLCPEKSRRQRLLDFCLKVLEILPIQSKTEMEILDYCLLCLIHGAPRFGSHGVCTRGSEMAGLSRSVKVAEIETCSSSTLLPYIRRAQCLPIRVLWLDPTPTGNLKQSSDVLDDYIRKDVSTSTRTVLTRELGFCQDSLVGFDTVSTSLSSTLSLHAITRISRLVDIHSSAPEKVLESSSCTNLCLWLKVLVSLFVTKSIKDGAEAIDELTNPLVEVINVGIGLLTTPIDDECFVVSVLTSLCQITLAILEHSALQRSPAPVGLTKAMNILLPALQNVLMSVDHLADVHAPQQQHRPPVRPSDFMEEDDDSVSSDQRTSESLVHTDFSEKELFSIRGKRKASESSLNPPKRKVIGPEALEPSRRLVAVVATLLIALEPSFQIFADVSRSLLGVDNFYAIDSMDSGVDVLGGIIAFQLLSTEAMFLYPASHRSGKASSKIDSFVLLAGQIVKAFCDDATDPLIVSFRFQAGARLVELTRSYPGSIRMSDEEACLLVELLGGGVEGSLTRDLAIRPALRALQLKSATFSFISGNEDFHAIMDKEFPRRFVLPSLADLDGVVRRQGAQAVAAALSVLPQDRVSSSVRKRLPRIGNFSEVAEGTKKWFNAIHSDKAEHPMWEDATKSVENGVLECWNVIVSATSSEEDRRRSMYDIVSVALKRPDLELVCYQSLDRAAVQCGYKSAHLLLESVQRDLVRLWIERNEAHLRDLPLLISAPSVLERARLLGLRATHFDAYNARATCSGHFLTRNLGEITIVIFCNVARSLVAQSVTKEGRRRLYEDRFMKDVCSVFSDRYDDGIVQDALIKFIPQLIATQETLFCGDEGDRRLAKELQSLSQAILSEQSIKEKATKRADVVFRRFLDATTYFPFSSSSFAERLLSLSESLADEKLKGSEPSLLQHCSVLELLTYSKFVLAKACVPAEAKKTFVPIQILCEVVSGQLRNHVGRCDESRIGLCLQILSSMIGNAGFTAVQGHAIRTLKSIIGSVVDAGVKHGAADCHLRLVLADILGSCMSAHEFWQNKFVVLCVENFRESEYCRVRRSGFMRLAEDEAVRDSWGWDSTIRWTPSNATSTMRALAEYRSHVDDEVLDCLVTTFEILKVVKNGAKSMGLEHNHFVGAHPPYSMPSGIQEILFELNASFCAQRLFQLEADPPLPSLLAPLFDPSRSLPSSTTFSSNDRICRAEVSAVSMHLRAHRPEAVEPLNPASLEELVRGLATLCGSQNSQELRSAASYCLGDIWPWSSGGEKLNWFPKKVEADRTAVIDNGHGFDLFLLSRVVTALSRSVLRSPPQTALIGLATIQALRSYSEFSSSFDFIDDVAVRSFLLNLGSPRGQTLATELCLSDGEEGRLRKQACTLCGSDLGEVQWCWGDQLWSISTFETPLFERWISIVVPGILVTHYPRATAALTPLFAHCQRMSVIDPSFSTFLFPAVLFDLLTKSQRSEQSPTPTCENQADLSFAGDSIFNQKISNCFRLMFSSSASWGLNSRAKSDVRHVELALDSIAYFQQYTKHRFLASNRKTKGRSSSKHFKSSASSQESGSENVAQGRCNVHYGTILRLNGLHVVEACMQVGRFASAMFFADLYADARFGGSTKSLKVIASLSQHNTVPSASSTRDISGLDTFDENSEPNEKITMNEASEFLKWLGLCCDSLGDPDTARCFQKANRELSMSFEPYAATSGIDSTVLCTGTAYGPDFQPDSSASQGLYAASCLSSLDLQSCAQSLITGIFSQPVMTQSFSAFEIQELREKWFECLLYRSRWEDDLFNQNSNPLGPEGAAGFYELSVDSLAAFARDDSDLCLSRLREARQLLVPEAALLSNPESSTQRFLDCLDRLNSLNDIECVVNSSCSAEEILKVYGFKLTKDSAVVAAIQDTAKHGRRQFGQTMSEVVMRSETMKLMREGREHDASAIRRELVANLWSVSRCSHIDGQHSSALSALNRISNLIREDGSDDFMSLMRVRLQEAVIFEHKGDFLSALRLSGHLIMLLKARANLGTERDTLLGEAMVLTGHWMSKYKLEPAQTILNSYLKPGAEQAVALYRTRKDTSSACLASRSLLELAHLSSSLFETVTERTKSSEWRSAERTLIEREIELQECRSIIDELQRQLKGQRKNLNSNEDTAKKLRDNMIYATQLDRQVRNARRERENVESSIEGYRKLTLKSIVSALSIAEVTTSVDYSRHVYRMVSLWFSAVSAHGGGFDEELSATMREAIEAVPSFRFVPMASQLFSRLGQTSNLDSTPILQDLIFQMCLDHPYHCLTHLLCLANGMEVGEGVGGRGRSDFLDNSRSSKVEVAGDILQRLRGADSNSCELLDCYQTLTDAYIHLALSSVEGFPRGEKLPFSKIGKSAANRLDQCIAKRLDKAAPCILTSPPTLRPRCDYLDAHGDLIGGERLVGFERFFSVATGGISKPKIVTCIGSNGSRFKQLVKGHDEIRQDAVMEQVFGYVNDLLTQRQYSASGSSHPGIKDRNQEHRISANHCRMVTYAIVPLSPASGIVEWVEDTLPFAHCVVETKSSGGRGTSLHSRYFPQEWSNVRCARRMQSAATTGPNPSPSPSPPLTATTNPKRAAYDEVCQHYTPCFRYFFVERFGHSMQGWYTAKQQFSKSVAVSSVVGHVLGIGDRHGHNILVHERTGEVVHIDFGIVFEQGKLLTVPEVVPFRLTPNLLDGLGPTGTDGLFTTTAESILSVLRDNASALLTILSAVVSDPLYLWSMSPVKARERQRWLEEEAATAAAAATVDNNGDNAVEVRPRRNDGGGGEGPPLAGLAPASPTWGDPADRNEAAAQAIAKVQEKLQGYEDGTSGEPQSVEGQVRWLLHTARAPDLLCEMYHGWQAWV